MFDWLTMFRNAQQNQPPANPAQSLLFGTSPGSSDATMGAAPIGQAPKPDLGMSAPAAPVAQPVAPPTSAPQGTQPTAQPSAPSKTPSFGDWMNSDDGKRYQSTMDQMQQRLEQQANPGWKKRLAMGLMFGMQDFGSTMNRGPAVGAENERQWSNNLYGLQNEARQYAVNRPGMLAQAYERAVTGPQQSNATARLTGAQADVEQNLANNPTMNPQYRQFYDEANKFIGGLRDAWSSGKYQGPAFDQLVQSQLQSSPYARFVTPDVIAQIKGLPQANPWQVVGKEGAAPEGVKDLMGNFVPAPQLNAQHPAFAQFQAAQSAYNTSRQDKLHDEQNVAGFAADRQGKQIAAAIQAANIGEQNKTLNAGRTEALKHLNDFSAANEQMKLVQDLAGSKSPTDQTSLAFKALGLDLPDGVHRINDAELHAIQTQGGLSDRAASALLNWTKGQKFDADILEDIKNTASKIALSKMATSNENLANVARVYGYKVQGADDTGRLSLPGQGGQGGEPTAVGPNGHAIAFRGGKWVDAQTGKAVQ